MPFMVKVKVNIHHVEKSCVDSGVLGCRNSNYISPILFETLPGASGNKG
jgi:hypothetical protein